MVERARGQIREEQRDRRGFSRLRTEMSRTMSMTDDTRVLMMFVSSLQRFLFHFLFPLIGLLNSLAGVHHGTTATRFSSLLENYRIQIKFKFNLLFM